MNFHVHAVHKTGLRAWLAVAPLFALVGVIAGPAAAQPAVSEGGQAAYSFPITVPPGIAAMQPKMALQHTGGRGGPFAAGWGLGGLSVVTRCGSTVAIDQARRGVLYTQKDRFCLDGQRLIAVQPGTGNPLPLPQPDYTGAETEFRTEKESYSRIRAYGGNAESGPTHFKVWTKSGLLYEYGLGGNSLIRTVKAGAETAVNATWAVNKILDKSGNWMSVSYASEINNAGAAWGREWMVSEIKYTGNDVTGQQPGNRLVFNYEVRPDKTESFHAQAATVATKRLASMAAYVGGTEVTFLKLGYSTSPGTGVSLLDSIQQCSGLNHGKCLPKTEFTYTQGPGVQFVEKAPSSLTTVQLSRVDNTKGYTRGSYQGDFNGDGKQDILIWDSDPTKNSVLLSTGDGNFSPVASDPVLKGLYTHLNHDNGCHYSVIADFNLDGIADILRITDPNARSHCSTLGAVSHVLLGTSSGQFQAPIELKNAATNALITLTRQDPAPPPYCNPDIFPQGCGDGWPTGTTGGIGFTLQDFTGDGFPDLLFTLSTETAATANPYCAIGEKTCLYKGGAAIGRFEKIPTSLSSIMLFSPTGLIYGQTGIGTYKAESLFVNDMNGDGLPDIYVRDSGQILFATGNPGEFTAAPGAPPCITGAEVLDINGDGKWDIACMDRAANGPFKAYVNQGGAFAYRSTLSNWQGHAPVCTVQEAEGQTTVECDAHTLGAARGGGGFITADLDGDGISDVLSLGKSQPGSFDANGYPASPLNSFLKGQRDGSFTPMAISVVLKNGTTDQLNNVKLEEGKNTVLFGDFTGSGSVEMLRFNQTAGENALFVRNDSRSADMLQTVKQAGNAVTTFNYKSTADASVYTRGFGATYPAVDQVANRWVVASLDAPNGLNGTTATSYHYFTQRADLSGRGSLGFGKIRKTAPGADGPPVTMETTYSQSFPYDSLPVETAKYVQGIAQPVSRTSSVYNKICTTGAPEIHRTILESNTEETRDLNGAWISQVKTENTGFNCYGDPGTVTVTTRPASGSSKTYVKQTVNTYLPAVTSGDVWILGRLQTADQSNTVPNETFAAVPAPGWPAPPGAPVAPTVKVTVAPSPMQAGQSAVRTWSVTGSASSLSFSCTAASGGYVASGSKAVTGGSDTLSPVSGWVGKPSTCVWTVTGPAGTSTATQVLTTILPPPTIAVTMSPAPAVAGTSATRSWSTTNATSVSFACTASGTGYNQSGTKPAVNGSDTLSPLTGWITNPSTCVWTATGSGGTTTVAHVITTVQPKPGITVSMNPAPAVVGSAATRSWSTTNATSLSFTCVAGTGGYNASGSKALSGSDTLTPAAAWVGNPSTCTWTAQGPGGTTTVSHVVAAISPPPTISVTASPSPLRVGQISTISWNTTNATSLSFSCTAAGTGYKGGGSVSLSGSTPMTGDAAWVGYPSSCVWTASNGSATTTFNATQTTLYPLPTVSVSMPSIIDMWVQTTINLATSNAVQVAFSCSNGVSLQQGNLGTFVNGALPFTPDNTWNGSWNCTWTATNGSGETASTNNTFFVRIPPEQP